MIEDITHKPILGVLPMLDIDLPEEDSQSSGLRRSTQSTKEIADVLVYREKQYNTLAQAIRENINMQTIYAILDAGLNQ
jgi:cobyric acid synthase